MFTGHFSFLLSLCHEGNRAEEELRDYNNFFLLLVLRTKVGYMFASLCWKLEEGHVAL